MSGTAQASLSTSRQILVTAVGAVNFCRSPSRMTPGDRPMILDDLEPYWTDVAQRWDRTVRIVDSATSDTSRRMIEITEVKKHPRLAEVTPIMVVGDRFAGKSALFHRISNSSGYLQRRTDDHTTHKVVIRGRKAQVNALVAVTPGQQVGEEFADGDIDKWNAMLEFCGLQI
ncbi:hypothetical protein ACLQ3F_04100 [Micromonospora sp. DT15]|uniref:hypothetical protein n=1 Tax=Micromonospora sp. DT15 TaxID=3393445 RepID=UPI003CEE4D40